MESRYYAGTKDGKSLSVCRVDESFQGTSIIIRFRTLVIFLALLLSAIIVFHFIRGSILNIGNTEEKNIANNTITVTVKNEEKNAVTPVQTAVNEKRIVFPESSSSLLSEKDIATLKVSKNFQKNLRSAINELYARHNLNFETDSIRKYYEQFDWYIPAKDEVPWEDFNEIEQENLTLLISIEEDYGYR